MKTIGLLGGMSWESTVTYYQMINRTVKEQLGGLHSAKCLLYSVDFHEIPILHIAEVTAEELVDRNIDTVALLGTKYTMEQDFYKEKLTGRGIRVIVPGVEDRERINNTIYQELCLGIISDDSRQDFLRIIDALMDQGAQGVILGCTEIGLLVKQSDTKAPLFDTTFLHGRRAALDAIGQ